MFYCMFFVCLLFVSDFSTTHILHAGALWFRMCLLPFWGLAKKGGNEIFVTVGVNRKFLHFGGF